VWFWENRECSFGKTESVVLGKENRGELCGYYLHRTTLSIVAATSSTIASSNFCVVLLQIKG